MSELKQGEGDFDPVVSVINFGKEFLGISMVKGKVDGRVSVWQEKGVGRWDDEAKYACYRDSDKNFYVCERNQGMVIYAEINRETIKN